MRILLLALLLFSQNAFGQSVSDPVVGTYASYLSQSNFIELTVGRNGTFTYYDVFELTTDYRFDGSWKRKGNRLTLIYSGEEQKVMPLKWKIKGEQLISPKFKSHKTGKKIKIVLTLNEHG